MKIIRIVSELDFGGVEKVLALSIPVLHALQGIEVKVLVLGKGGKVEKELKSHGISIEVWNQNPIIPNFGLIWKLINYLKIEKPTVIHTQGAESNFHGIIAGFISKVPLRIAEEIGMPNHHTYWKFIFQCVYKMSSHIIAVAENVKNKIVRFKEAKENKIQVIYNPVKLNRVAIKRTDSQNFVFISVSRLVPIKNLTTLINVFSQFYEERDSIKLWIVGDGSERGYLENYCIEKNLQRAIRFLGFQQDVSFFLAKADVFLLPSLSEGSPLSLAEAMLAGLPSVITKIGGASEILGNSRSGILVDPYNPDEIKQAMQTMFNLSYEERNELGARANLEAGRFSLDSYINSLIKIYQLKG